MTRGETFIGKRKYKNNQCSLLSNSAWCDLNIKRDILKLHDFCHNPKCKGQKHITYNPFQLEGAASENTMKKHFKGSQRAWNKILQPAVNVAAPLIGLALTAKSKSAQIGQTTTNISKSISGGKISSLFDMHGNRFRLKVMKHFNSNELF